MSDNDELGSGQIAAPCTFRREGWRADVRCKREIERNARRKRTLRASASFFRCANAANGGSGVGFSDATGAAFELRVALPGVGEALKREIVGLVWVDRLLLWGFAQCVCFRPELTGQFGGAH